MKKLLAAWNSVDGRLAELCANVVSGEHRHDYLL